MTLTHTLGKAPLCRSTTYSGHSPFPPAGDAGWVNQSLLCLERHSTLSPGIEGEGGERLRRSVKTRELT
jgi:hypothetical protein